MKTLYFHGIITLLSDISLKFFSISVCDLQVTLFFRKLVIFFNNASKSIYTYLEYSFFFAINNTLNRIFLSRSYVYTKEVITVSKYKEVSNLTIRFVAFVRNNP